MAPAKIRGALNMGFQIAITIGILVANLVNYGTNKMKGGMGWRVSLGVAAAPALVMTVGSIVLPDTPNSMLERGKVEEAKQMLRKVRGVENVEQELQDLMEACEAANKVENPWKNITQSHYRPQLTFCIFIPFFQQMTGINIIMFYAPVLFKTLGFRDDASLMSSVITGVVNVAATFVSVFAVDRVGRRWLFLQGGIQMIVCMCGAAVLMAVKYGVTGQGSMSKAEADVLLIMICAFVAGYAWSWGPLGWLVPTEVCSLDVRSTGQAINVSVNMAFTFIVAQAFLTMLCHMKFGLFFFLAGFIAIMTVFIHLLLPETKDVPIEQINIVWNSHWLWRNYIPPPTTSPSSADRSL